VKTLGLIVATIVFLSGCGSPLRDEPSTPPLRASEGQVAMGQRVFMQHCHQCHPGGSAGLAPAINNKPLPQWLMKFQVRHGLGAMPKFSGKHIRDDELDALVVYLTKLRHDTE